MEKHKHQKMIGTPWQCLHGRKKSSIIDLIGNVIEFTASERAVLLMHRNSDFVIAVCRKAWMHPSSYARS